MEAAAALPRKNPVAPLVSAASCNRRDSVRSRAHQRHYRADLRTPQRFHHGPNQILRPFCGDVKDLIRFSRHRAADRADKGNDPAQYRECCRILGQCAPTDRRKRDGASQARAFYFMDAACGQAAVRKPAVHRISYRNGPRKPALRFLQAAIRWRSFSRTGLRHLQRSV